MALASTSTPTDSEGSANVEVQLNADLKIYQEQV